MNAGESPAGNATGSPGCGHPEPRSMPTGSSADCDSSARCQSADSISVRSGRSGQKTVREVRPAAGDVSCRLSAITGK
ncbi:hypothetical protein HMPREF2139_01525 [Prevotella denticola DNF00960]|nr:hypothetical protein HMPREF2139_01525 [Prevotella denticola DNF00960]